MKTIAKEDIDILEMVVFEKDGVRRLDMSIDGFKVCAMAAHPIKKGEEVEYLYESGKDFITPEVRKYPIYTSGS